MASELIIRSVEEADALMLLVRASAARARDWMSTQTEDPLEMLRRIKFEPVGFHPIEDRPLNFIEQINQTWTFAVPTSVLCTLSGIPKRYHAAASARSTGGIDPPP
ncbi:hypothetical protein FHP25_24460 [Vineibacter terrae]|uniref:Uncharacterized protein n=1 Tax=Vineibacter terrae TaxID=2586908 RepID=A0A5C8PHN1_9HYPH|nr:hypothetical protein [Vineibacter terrae]TXL72706.1 hypothetical protein FHP25_24460 [Vineibacter terrae]